MTVFCSAQEFENLLKDLPDNVRRVRLQVKGGSMEPFIQSGDWVTVTLHRAGDNDIKKGDIALFKIDASLYLHRVVGLKTESVVAKGDASFGHDGIIPNYDILGKVIILERHGRVIDMTSAPPRFFSFIMVEMGAVVQYVILFSRKIARICRSLILRVQNLAAYRKLVKKMFPADTVIREAKPEDAEAMRDLFIMGGHDIKKDIIDIKREGFWLVAVRRNKVVGAITVTRYEYDSKLWVIFGLEVKPLFRGLGIGLALVRKAMTLSERSGGREIGLFVNKKSRPALNLYSSLGFVSTEDFPKDFNRSPDEIYLSHKF